MRSAGLRTGFCPAPTSRRRRPGRRAGPQRRRSRPHCSSTSSRRARPRTSRQQSAEAQRLRLQEVAKRPRRGPLEAQEARCDNGDASRAAALGLEARVAAVWRWRRLHCISRLPAPRNDGAGHRDHRSAAAQVAIDASRRQRGNADHRSEQPTRSRIRRRDQGRKRSPIGGQRRRRHG